jgi:hypothetical protein
VLIRIKELDPEIEGVEGVEPFQSKAAQNSFGTKVAHYF